MTSPPPLARRLFAELLGSGFLATVVIGSGIAAQTPLARQHRPRATGERARDRRRTVRDHPHVRAGLRRTLQPGRLARRRGLRRHPLAGRARLHPAQVAGCILGAIVANGMFSLAAISISTHHRASPRPPVLRGDRDCRPFARDLLARADATRRRRPGRCRRVHRRRVLLHQLGELRQPRDQYRAHVLQHVRRDRASVCARLHRRPARRWRRRDPPHQDALPGPDTRRGGRRRRPAPATPTRDTPLRPTSGP